MKLLLFLGTKRQKSMPTSSTDSSLDATLHSKYLDSTLVPQPAIKNTCLEEMDEKQNYVKSKKRKNPKENIQISFVEEHDSLEVRQGALKSSPRLRQDATECSPRLQQAALKSSPRLQQGALECSPRLHQGVLESSPRLKQGALKFSPRLQKGALECNPRFQQGVSESSPRLQECTLKFTPRLQQQPVIDIVKVVTSPKQKPKRDVSRKTKVSQDEDPLGKLKSSSKKLKESAKIEKVTNAVGEIDLNQSVESDNKSNSEASISDISIPKLDPVFSTGHSEQIDNPDKGQGFVEVVCTEYQCTQCEFVTKDKLGIVEHQSLHGAKTVVCQKCRFVFESQENMNRWHKMNSINHEKNSEVLERKATKTGIEKEGVLNAEVSPLNFTKVNMLQANATDKDDNSYMLNKPTESGLLFEQDKESFLDRERKIQKYDELSSTKYGFSQERNEKLGKRTYFYGPTTLIPVRKSTSRDDKQVKRDYHLLGLNKQPPLGNKKREHSWKHNIESPAITPARLSLGKDTAGYSGNENIACAPFTLTSARFKESQEESKAQDKGKLFCRQYIESGELEQSVASVDSDLEIRHFMQNKQSSETDYKMSVADVAYTKTKTSETRNKMSYKNNELDNQDFEHSAGNESRTEIELLQETPKKKKPKCQKHNAKSCYSSAISDSLSTANHLGSLKRTPEQDCSCVMCFSDPTQTENLRNTHTSCAEKTSDVQAVTKKKHKVKKTAQVYPFVKRLEPMDTIVHQTINGEVEEYKLEEGLFGVYRKRYKIPAKTDAPEASHIYGLSRKSRKIRKRGRKRWGKVKRKPKQMVMYHNPEEVTRQQMVKISKITTKPRLGMSVAMLENQTDIYTYDVEDTGDKGSGNKGSGNLKADRSSCSITSGSEIGGINRENADGTGDGKDDNNNNRENKDNASAAFIEMNTELHPCLICQASYNSKTSLLRHLTRIHRLTNLCQICYFDEGQIMRFANPVSLRNHKVRDHPEDMVKCSCGTMLIDQKTLTIHLKKFKCDLKHEGDLKSDMVKCICGKRFASRDLIESHKAKCRKRIVPEDLSENESVTTDLRSRSRSKDSSSASTSSFNEALDETLKKGRKCKDKVQNYNEINLNKTNTEQARLELESKSTRSRGRRGQHRGRGRASATRVLHTDNQSWLEGANIMGFRNEDNRTITASGPSTLPQVDNFYALALHQRQAELNNNAMLPQMHVQTSTDKNNNPQTTTSSQNFSSSTIAIGSVPSADKKKSTKQTTKCSSKKVVAVSTAPKPKRKKMIPDEDGRFPCKTCRRRYKKPYLYVHQKYAHAKKQWVLVPSARLKGKAGKVRHILLLSFFGHAIITY